MTIDEALLRLEILIDSNEGDFGGQDAQAIKLGIEALEKLKELRTGSGVIFDRPLPGETEE